MKKLLLILSISIIAFGMDSQRKLDPEQNVFDVLASLGDSRPEHYVDNISADKIWRGEQLIKYGKVSSPDGSSGKFISKFYNCTSCHNTQREDPDLKLIDPTARLDYAIQNNLPYLQGSTFWGIVNRESWYNDDYVLKYGDLVNDAQSSLKGAINLCATVCSQGRTLEDWEMESILAYFWSLQMKIGDLNLNDDLSTKITSTDINNSEKINLLKSTYLLKSPATFSDPPENKQEGYHFDGNPNIGKEIYSLSCKHCHRPNGESDVIFDDSPLTFNWLKNNITSTTQKSIYEIIRKGTYSEYGHKEYMPHFTLEKMSDEQIEHLRAYIENPDIN